MATLTDDFERAAVNPGGPVQYTSESGGWDINGGSLRNTSGSTCLLRPNSDIFASADQRLVITVDNAHPTTTRAIGGMLRVTNDALAAMDGYSFRYEGGQYQIHVVTNNAFTVVGTALTEAMPALPFDFVCEVEGSTLRILTGPVGGPYTSKRSETNTTHTVGRRFALRAVTTTQQRVEAINAADIGSPVANAGADQSVDVGSLVTLNGSGSTGASSYSWSHVSGPSNAGMLSSTSLPSPTYTPTVAGIDVWRLTVTALNGLTSTDTVQVLVGISTVDVYTGEGGGWTTRALFVFNGTDWV